MSDYERRTAVLRDRAAFLRKRAREQGSGDAAGRSLAEISAIEWALAELAEPERLRETIRAAIHGLLIQPGEDHDLRILMTLRLLRAALENPLWLADRKGDRTPPVTAAMPPTGSHGLPNTVLDSTHAR